MMRIAAPTRVHMFGGPDSIREVQEYQVALSSVTVLELVINPNMGGGAARFA